MIINSIILFVLTFGTGYLVFFLPNVNNHFFKFALVFAGAYLFSVTVIHILPEIFSQGESVSHISLYVLAGFFIQVILEYFSEGVEHGHLHTVHENHQHGQNKWLGLLIALSIHAFLEGTLLAHPDTIHSHDNSNSVFFGILMHKMPAAFALMSVMICHLHTKWKTILILVIFSLASPAGLGLSHILHDAEIFSDKVFLILFALVSGNFLHISTTIFFESSPDHSFNFKKLFISLLGALVAVLAEFSF
ncbi:ZIP family metal transporter [uncultured Marivirga sp.]|uniref:ZIP family metal transporter n=1 Tax=uncultured Marivirga sp. TaxID=1123707 RepID=UPI0030EC83CC|tara:strand:- start:67490 stop:68233 length:744 start_codon:yes stop_codon:yes gene_type:complete